jgi:hypothetical protein
MPASLKIQEFSSNPINYSVTPATSVTSVTSATSVTPATSVTSATSAPCLLLAIFLEGDENVVAVAVFIVDGGCYSYSACCC